MAARVLLGLEALGLLGISLAFAYLQFAFALWASSDTQEMGILLRGVWIGLGLISASLILSGAPLMLTFVSRRWAYFVVLAVELALALAFVLMLVLAALQPAPGLETEHDIGLGIGVVLVILPSSVCFLLVFPAEVHKHFGL